jgi:hypothetical protein
MVRDMLHGVVLGALVFVAVHILWFPFDDPGPPPALIHPCPPTAVVANRRLLSSLRVAVHLTFYHDGVHDGALDHLFRVVETLLDAGAARMDLFIHTNNETDSTSPPRRLGWWKDRSRNLIANRPLPPRTSVHVRPHDLRLPLPPYSATAHPYLLSLAHRSLVADQVDAGAYDLWAYLEGDVLLTASALECWLRARTHFLTLGATDDVLPTLLRVERDASGALVASDAWPLDPTAVYGNATILPTSLYAHLPRNYWAGWINDAREMRRWRSRSEWTAPVGDAWMLRENAAWGNAVPGKRLLLLPLRSVDTTTTTTTTFVPSADCFVYHLPNKVAADPALQRSHATRFKPVLVPLRLDPVRSRPIVG